MKGLQRWAVGFPKGLISKDRDSKIKYIYNLLK
jgi:hypothetical protein